MNKDFLNPTKYYSEGAALTGAVFAKILVILFNGSRFHRKEAIEQVKAYHLKNGGYLRDEACTRAFKDATNNFLQEYVTNTAYGEWELNVEEDIYLQIANRTKSSVSPKLADEPTQFEADQTIGEGSQSVYLYYLDSYRDGAERDNKDIWPCKIGRTTTSIGQRISDLSRTVYPEKPHVALSIQTDDSKMLEGIIHSILIYNGRIIDDATGAEWFSTSPEEVKAIYEGLRL